MRGIFYLESRRPDVFNRDSDRIVGTSVGTIVGAETGNRTRNLWFTIPLLYQLSPDASVGIPTFRFAKTSGLLLEPMVGLEPTTCGLRYRCSTIELHRRKFYSISYLGIISIAGSS